MYGIITLLINQQMTGILINNINISGLDMRQGVEGGKGGRFRGGYYLKELIA